VILHGAGDLHGAARYADCRVVGAAARPLAVAAMTVTHEHRIAGALIAHRSAHTSALCRRHNSVLLVACAPTVSQRGGRRNGLFSASVGSIGRWTRLAVRRKLRDHQPDVKSSPREDDPHERGE